MITFLGYRRCPFILNAKSDIMTSFKFFIFAQKGCLLDISHSLYVRSIMNFLLLLFNNVHLEGLQWHSDKECDDLGLNPDLCKWVVFRKLITIEPNKEDSGRENQLVTRDDKFVQLTHLWSWMLFTIFVNAIWRLFAHKIDVINQVWASSEEQNHIALIDRISKSLGLLTQSFLLVKLRNFSVSY